MTDRIADRGLVNEPVYITDLSAVEPADAVGSVPAFHRWRAMDYTAGDLSGQLLLAGPETAAPDVTLDLNASGWHSVSLGLMPPPGYEGAPLKVLARLSGDTTPTMLTAEAGHPDRGHDLRIVDLYWRSADLTGQQLVLGQPQWQTAPVDAVGAWRSEIVRIAYIKLVPLTDAETAEALAERQRGETRQLFAHQDAHGPHYLWRLDGRRGQSGARSSPIATPTSPACIGKPAKATSATTSARSRAGARSTMPRTLRAWATGCTRRAGGSFGP